MMFLDSIDEPGNFFFFFMFFRNDINRLDAILLFLGMRETDKMQFFFLGTREINDCHFFRNERFSFVGTSEIYDYFCRNGR